MADWTQSMTQLVEINSIDKDGLFNRKNRSTASTENYMWRVIQLVYLWQGLRVRSNNSHQTGIPTCSLTLYSPLPFSTLFYSTACPINTRTLRPRYRATFPASYVLRGWQARITHSPLLRLGPLWYRSQRAQWNLQYTISVIFNGTELISTESSVPKPYRNFCYRERPG